MADGVQFAKDRIAFFEAETDRLRHYIRMSEKLFAQGWLGPADDADPRDAAPARTSQPASAEGAPRAAQGNGAAEDEDDSLTLELKGDDGELGKKNGADPDRKSIFRRPTP